MHLSHVTEDLEAWYINFDFDERVDDRVPAEAAGEAERADVPQGRKEVSDEADVRRDFERTGRIGHSAAIQTTSRLAADASARRNALPKGTAIPIRADFNTLDNPFEFSDSRRGSEPARCRQSLRRLQPDERRLPPQPPRDGRRAPDGTLPSAAGPQPGLQLVLRTTHRQNFLVPPRRHRSFPLAEI
jgi:hypothetical protein